MNNKQILQNHIKNKKSLKIKQIDIKSGKTVNVFKNRYQAAIWILENGLSNYFYESIGKTRCCIAGGLTAALLKSNTSNLYGYKWKILPENDKSKITYFPQKLKTGAGSNRGKPVVIHGIIDKIKMPSITAAATFLSIKKNQLTKQLDKHKKFAMEDGTMIKTQRNKSTKGEYNKVLTTLKQEIPVVAKNIVTNEMIKFSSMSKAARVFLIHRDTIKNSISKQKPHKNIQWKLLVK